MKKGLCWIAVAIAGMACSITRTATDVDYNRLQADVVVKFK